MQKKEKRKQNKSMTKYVKNQENKSAERDAMLKVSKLIKEDIQNTKKHTITEEKHFLIKKKSLENVCITHLYFYKLINAPQGFRFLYTGAGKLSL